MSILNNSLLLGAPAAATGYSIARSLRFNSADSSYLSRTFGTPTTQNTFTFSTWVKRSTLSTLQYIFGVSTNHSLGFTSSDALNLTFAGTSALTTSAVFRDPAAWYHIVWTQNGTAHTLYVNNVSVGTATATSSVFNTAVAHQIGARNTGSFFAGYLTEIHFIDGQALTPSSFGQTDANNIWQPKAYAGTYGNNGFKLTFSDNSATTATTLGKDSAGSNNWTPNNFIVTAGVGNDSLVDTPTNGTASTGGDAGGVVVGNYCTLNTLSTLTSIGSTTNGNLDFAGSNNDTAIATFGMSSGSWYWEASTTDVASAKSIGLSDGTSAFSMFSFSSSNTVFGFRFNADTGVLERTSNGTTWTLQATALTSGPYFVYLANDATNTNGKASLNFGQQPFTWAAPSGYKSLNTANLPTPTVPNGATAMDVVTYTGTGASLTPTSSLGFSPDLVWIKSRSAANDSAIYDTVRGAQIDLVSNSAAAETTQTTGLTAFNSAGFTVGTLAKLNTSAATYAAWCWDAGSSTVSNTSGTITSQVRANTTAGCSVLTYTGTGANATVGHGLGIAPSLVIVKNRGATSGWRVRHPNMANSRYLELNSTLASTSGTTVWNNTAPTSTLFSIGTSTNTNASGSTYIAYCFAPVTGFSAFGSYSGNGSNNGPFIYTGFRPRFIIIKSDSLTNWRIYDTARIGYNVKNNSSYTNVTNAESSASEIAIFSNGFKLYANDGDINASAVTNYWMAWAENPFSIARAR